ncbi:MULTISPECIES: hypothetical protein [unclassified Campylobacter]|uniref:hypothetical protein n=1 Tax=unclassified Campylobacter TaxID=2593542 RepID=UPI0022EA08A5|nr:MULTISPECIES: hypothetical protein [unclassified Campylobacter]MDA3062484.1 hypothetical protein [Campylobacter sp. JMF_14 EL1]MDA3073397.1 hypothetical protein [Campylobacter sp. JMF_10 EL2]
MKFYVFDDGLFFAIAIDEKCEKIFDWCGGEIGDIYADYVCEYMDDGVRKSFVFEDGEVFKGDFSDCVLRADEKRKQYKIKNQKNFRKFKISSCPNKKWQIKLKGYGGDEMLGRNGEFCYFCDTGDIDEWHYERLKYFKDEMCIFTYKNTTFKGTLYDALDFIKEIKF